MPKILRISLNLELHLHLIKSETLKVIKFTSLDFVEVSLSSNSTYKGIYNNVPISLFR